MHFFFEFSKTLKTGVLRTLPEKYMNWLLRLLKYRPSPCKFPPILESPQEIFFLESTDVKSEILNCRPATLKKKDCFAKAFLKLSKF